MTTTHRRTNTDSPLATTGSTARDPLDVTGIAVPARATRWHSVSSTRDYEQCPSRYWYTHGPTSNCPTTTDPRYGQPAG